MKCLIHVSVSNLLYHTHSHFSVCLSVCLYSFISSSSHQHLAAVLLKKLIISRWSNLDIIERNNNIDNNNNDHNNDIGNDNVLVSDEDKSVLKHMLPRGLSAPESCIRVSIGVAIAAIAYRDWPEQW